MYRRESSPQAQRNLSSAENSMRLTLPVRPLMTRVLLPVAAFQRKTGAAVPLKFLVPTCPDAISLPLLETASAVT